MELLAIIAENEYIRIENEKLKALLSGTHCPHLTQKGLPCKNNGLCALSIAKGSLDWNEIIDAAVYGNVQRGTKGSGFRMIWSHKMAKGVEQLACLPVFVYTHGPLSTILKIDRKPDLEILKMSVVRTDAPQTHVIEPPSTTIGEGKFTREQTKDEIHNEELRDLSRVRTFYYFY